MELEFLLSRVYINDELADVQDKLIFCEDYKSGKIKGRIYRYNGIIDVVTE